MPIDNPWEIRWRDYYQALGVPESASSAEINQAHRRKARFLHPDRMAGETEEVRRLAEADLKLLNEAYEVLNDSHRRKTYDEAYAKRSGLDNHSAGGSGGRRDQPELEVDPGDVIRNDIDAEGGIVTFSVAVRQTSGPAFDPAFHKLQVTMEPPWEADMFTRIETSSDRPPMTIGFDLDASRLEQNEEYSGLIHIEVTGR